MRRTNWVWIPLLGTVGGLLLAVGLCLCLLPAWNAMTPGVVVSLLGAGTLLAIWPLHRKASGKTAVHLTAGYIAATLLGLAGAAALGIGLVHCLQAVTPFGLGVGIVGLVLLLAAILTGRRAAGKKPLRLLGRQVLGWGIGLAGVLLLGVGMCITMVWSSGLPVWGILVGSAGLLVCILNGVLRRRPATGLRPR